MDWELAASSVSSSVLRCFPRCELRATSTYGGALGDCNIIETSFWSRVCLGGYTNAVRFGLGWLLASCI